MVCAKLMRALYRLAAIQIVERFQGVLLDVVAAWLRKHGRQVAPGGSDQEAVVRRAAERWKAKARSAPADDSPPVNVQLIWAALRSVMQQAHVVEVEAGAALTLCASAVLVRGQVEAAEGGPAALAPCVLAWPEFKTRGAAEAAEMKVHAGARVTPECMDSRIPADPGRAAGSRLPGGASRALV